MFSRIVVPVAMDQLSRGEEILAKAKALLGEGGEIILLNVVEDMTPYTVGYMVVDFPTDLVETSRQSAIDQLTKLQQANGFKGRVEVRIGGAASTINSFAEEVKADLVVVASHRPGLVDYFLGSTAERVARHCKCSVLIDR